MGDEDAPATRTRVSALVLYTSGEVTLAQLTTRPFSKSIGGCFRQ